MTAPLVSRAVMAARDPDLLQRLLAERMRAYDADVVAEGRQAFVRYGGGKAQIEARRDALFIEAQAGDLAALAVVKGAIAFQLQDIVGARRHRPASDGPVFEIPVQAGLVWEGDGCGSQLPHFREMHVVEAFDVTPRMRRLRLWGEDLARFAAGGLHARLLIPPKGRPPVWPHAGPAALPVWPTGPDRLTLRTYTIRRIDAVAGLVDIDIALHDKPTVGSDFARSAGPGDPVGLMGPGGAAIVPAAWTLLVGDETALPVIARVLEEMPRRSTGVALIEIADQGERQAIDAPAGVDIRWIHRNGAPAGTSGLLRAALAEIDWPDHDDVFAFGGAEFVDFKALRQAFRRERGLGRDRHSATAYWRRGICEGDLGG